MSERCQRGLALARRSSPYSYFFATLKGELVDHEQSATRAQARTSIDDYLANFYNVQRRHSTLGYLSPMEYELKLRSRIKAA